MSKFEKLPVVQKTFNFANTRRCSTCGRGMKPTVTFSSIRRSLTVGIDDKIDDIQTLCGECLSYLLVRLRR